MALVDLGSAFPPCDQCRVSDRAVGVKRANGNTLTALSLRLHQNYLAKPSFDSTRRPSTSGFEAVPSEPTSHCEQRGQFVECPKRHLAFLAGPQTKFEALAQFFLKRKAALLVLHHSAPVKHYGGIPFA